MCRSVQERLARRELLSAKKIKYPLLKIEMKRLKTGGDKMKKKGEKRAREIITRK